MRTHTWRVFSAQGALCTRSINRHRSSGLVTARLSQTVTSIQPPLHSTVTKRQGAQVDHHAPVVGQRRVRSRTDVEFADPGQVRCVFLIA